MANRSSGRITTNLRKRDVSNNRAGRTDFSRMFDDLDAGDIRLNEEDGCVRCGLLGCEWAHRQGHLHRTNASR